MEYIRAEKEYFKNYIEGGLKEFDNYITRKSTNSVWGDDLEIQAMREIYNLPIEIYAYSSKPMKTFHEEDGETRVFRLSYHGKSHYNAIVPLDWTVA